jgi:hypothetical protein
VNVRWRFATVGALLLVAVGWSHRWASHVERGAELAPARLVLQAGEQAELRLVNHEPQVVALGFRLRFDEGVAEVDAEAPPGGLSADGSMVHLGVRRRPGVLEVPGVAVTGGRTFRPWDTLYRFTVRGVRPGATTLTVEELTVVDLGEERRALPVVPAWVAVRGP